MSGIDDNMYLRKLPIYFSFITARQDKFVSASFAAYTLRGPASLDLATRSWSNLGSVCAGIR